MRDATAPELCVLTWNETEPPQDNKELIRWRLSGAEVFLEKRRADPTKSTRARRSDDDDDDDDESREEGDRWDGFSKLPRLDPARVEKGVWEGDTGALFTVGKQVKISPWCAPSSS